MGLGSEKQLTAMLKLLSVFLLVTTIAGVVGRVGNLDFYEESSYSDPAAFQVPGTPIKIILERRQIHLFLAEYERMLVLRVDGKEVLRHEVAVDTGGCSRMNIFQLSDGEYFLIGELSFDNYFLDLNRESLTQVIEKPRTGTGQFVGSFDRDEKGWRFIPVSEREMQKSLFDRHGGI